jgi:hypothetical protein
VLPPPVVLYSTNSWLAFNVAERYFGGEHYVWCTPYFREQAAGPVYTVPPTSSPWEIYRSLYIEVAARDRHSTKIDQNKVGILKGAAIKKRHGIINDAQENEIKIVVDSAEKADFRPLLYVIPYHCVAGILTEVPVAERAHPLSVEYRIESLPRSCFDVIEISWS